MLSVCLGPRSERLALAAATRCEWRTTADFWIEQKKKDRTVHLAYTPPTKSRYRGPSTISAHCIRLTRLQVVKLEKEGRKDVQKRTDTQARQFRVSAQTPPPFSPLLISAIDAICAPDRTAAIGECLYDRLVCIYTVIYTSINPCHARPQVCCQK